MNFFPPGIPEMIYTGYGDILLLGKSEITDFFLLLFFQQNIIQS